MIKESPRHPILTAYFQAEETLTLKREALEQVQKRIRWLEDDLQQYGLPSGMVANYEPLGTQGGVLYSDTTFDAMQRLRARSEERLAEQREKEHDLLIEIDQAEDALLPLHYAVEHLDAGTKKTLRIRFASTYESNRGTSRQTFSDESSIRDCLDKAEAIVKEHVAKISRFDITIIQQLDGCGAKILPAFSPQ